jgi:hypothetical protein
LPASALDCKDGNAHLIPPKEINPQISEQVNNAIMEGMRLEPEARPQTMREWLDLLGLTINAVDHYFGKGLIPIRLWNKGH